MSRARGSLLVVAGEASGDRIAAEILGALAEDEVVAFGIAGRACRARGMETFADTSDIAAMGTIDVLGRLPALGRALAELVRRVRTSAPRVALLVNFTEANARIGRALKRRGTRVLWCVAPQVWAWRPDRLRALHGSVDKLAVILPFEEPLWRSAGYDAHFVGHPSIDVDRLPRERARERLGLGGGRALALLPGSRGGEVTRLAPAFCEAASRLASRADIDEARLIIAPWLDARARDALTREALRAGVGVVEADANRGALPWLGAFDLSLCASGTACLEAALSGVPTVIAYRVDPLTYAVARRLVQTPWIGLPNVLLGRAALPELLQDAATGASLASSARSLLEPEAHTRALATSSELRALLTASTPGTFGEHVAALLRPWL